MGIRTQYADQLTMEVKGESVSTSNLFTRLLDILETQFMLFSMETPREKEPPLLFVCCHRGSTR